MSSFKLRFHTVGLTKPLVFALIQSSLQFLAQSSLADAQTTSSNASTSAPSSETSSASEYSWIGKATNAQGETLATIKVDTSQAPDLEAWGRHAGELCVEWYPKICELLASDGFVPPQSVRLRFRDESGVAATGGNTISINANYVRHATNDFGMVIHELTHVVQSYHRGRVPGWLTEGIADYIRLAHFEPQARRPRINPDRASYRDAYKTTAIFLEWAENKYDKALVRKLNSAAREGQYGNDLFKDYTGKTVDELWQEFTATLRPKPEVPAANSPSK